MSWSVPARGRPRSSPLTRASRSSWFVCSRTGKLRQTFVILTRDLGPTSQGPVGRSDMVTATAGQGTTATGIEPTSGEQPEEAVGRAPRARLGALVWGVGMIGYVFAVMQRTSFGVAGLDAAERFSISPAALSTFVFLQVAVYIAAQVPGGLLVDRWGSRRVLVGGSLMLAAGQLLLAFAPALPVVVLARLLVGAGDGVMFVAVLGLVPRWFVPGRIPLVTQLTGILGQLGQILSAVPFSGLLHAAGWSPAFSAAAAASVVAAVLTIALVRNAPAGSWTPPAAGVSAPAPPPPLPLTSPAGSWPPAPAVSLRETGRQLGAVWRRPGTRL